MDEKDIIKIAETLAMALIDVIKGTKSCTLTNDLLMTELESTIHQYDGIIFSGGVAEMIYGEDLSHNDIGNIISKFLVEKLIDENIIETPNKIRATVIGAGSYSLSVSGSTIYYDKEINFPLINIPVLVIDINKKKFNRKYVIDQISQAFIRYDLIEGDDTIALYFDDPIYARDLYLNEFVYALEDALPNSINNKQLIILIFRTDVGGTIGRTLKQKTSMKNNFISMDEIELHTGDWIDIGSPLSTGDAFPVTIKSLVFNK